MYPALACPKPRLFGIPCAMGFSMDLKTEEKESRKEVWFFLKDVASRFLVYPQFTRLVIFGLWMTVYF